MTVSIIIPTYNRDEILRSTLLNILQYADQYCELIVSDQSDSHKPEIQYFLDKLVNDNKILLIKPAYPNTCNAKNEGIRAASGDIMLFFDDDVSITDDCIQSHLRRYSDPFVGAVTGKVIVQNSNQDQNIVFKKRFSKKDIFKSFFFFFFRKKAAYISRFGVAADFSGNKVREADTGIGCNLSFRKEVFYKAGFFDTNFTGNAYREETDMCVRTMRAGYKIIYEPKAEIAHYMNNSGGSRTFENEKYWRAYFKNQCYFFIKNFNSPIFLIGIVSFFDLLRCKRQGFPAITVFHQAFMEAKKIVSAMPENASGI
jgi:GT2 family glycosyltransferase